MSRRGYRRNGPVQPLPDLANRSIWLQGETDCHYCGAPLAPEARTKDHVVPVYRGGPDALDNIVICCGPCNRKKNFNRTNCECGLCTSAWRKYGPPGWEKLSRMKLVRP